MIKDKYEIIYNYLLKVKEKYGALSKLEVELGLTKKYLHNLMTADYSKTTKSDKIEKVYNLIIKKC